MVVNDNCSSWYNKIGDFLLSVWDRRKEILYGDGSTCMVSPINPTPESARSMALSAVAVESE